MNLGGSLYQQGKHVAAVAVMRNNFEIKQRVLGDNHVRTFPSQTLSPVPLSFAMIKRVNGAFW